MPEDKVKPTVASPKSGAERRRYRRYSFVADAEFQEVLETESGNLIEAAVTLLGQRGCYLKAAKSLPVGTLTLVRIRKGGQALDVRARVVYSQAGEGMGLEFIPIESEQSQILEDWLGASRESAWQSIGRRRSQRLLLRIRVRVSGENSLGERFEEQTNTLVASPYGALVLLATPVEKGQRITLSNLVTNMGLECDVVYIGDPEGRYVQIGVDFVSPNPIFWQVAFPPEDWTPRHPDAKSTSSSRTRRRSTDHT